MVLRWFAAGYLETEKHFRRIMGHECVWMLAAALREANPLSDDVPSSPIRLTERRDCLYLSWTLRECYS